MKIFVSAVRKERVIEGSNVLFYIPPMGKYDSTIYNRLHNEQMRVVLLFRSGLDQRLYVEMHID